MQKLQAHVSTKYIKLDPKVRSLVFSTADKLESARTFELAQNKHLDCFWTSDWNEKEQRSLWEKTDAFLSLTSQQHYNVFLLRPLDCKLLVLDSREDIIAASEHYSYPADFFNSPSLNSLADLRLSLNYTRIKKDYDGVCLTKRGLKESREIATPLFSGWDCPCTMWFNWVFDLDIKCIHKFLDILP